MQERYRMFRRAGGNFYTRDKITGKSESLETSDRIQAKQLLAARNQSVAQPQLNRSMAKAYLSAKSPDLKPRLVQQVKEARRRSAVVAIEIQHFSRSRTANVEQSTRLIDVRRIPVRNSSFVEIDNRNGVPLTPLRTVNRAQSDGVFRVGKQSKLFKVQGSAAFPLLYVLNLHCHHLRRLRDLRLTRLGNQVQSLHCMSREHRQFGQPFYGVDARRVKAPRVTSDKAHRFASLDHATKVSASVNRANGKLQCPLQADVRLMGGRNHALRRRFGNPCKF